MSNVLTVEVGNETASAFLEPYIQSGNLNFLIGSGASAPAIKTAATIENEINKLLSDGKEEHANRKCLDFLSEINFANSRIASGTHATTKTVAESYAEFLSCIDRILFARKNIILPRQANVFTTNYDVFLEHAANLIPAVILNDGFDRSSSLGSEFTFSPERYFDRTYRSGPSYSHQIEIPTINLVKLHGSLSWRKRLDTLVFDPTPIPPLPTVDRANPIKVVEFLGKHFLILPNLRKFHATLMERVYYDLLRIFSKAMDQQNVVLICFGFSFSDEHLLDITRRALRNPTSHLIIFSYENTSSTDFQIKFSKQRNVTVVAPEPGSLIDFPRFNKILSSILPVQAHAA